MHATALPPRYGAGRWVDTRGPFCIALHTTLQTGSRPPRVGPYPTLALPPYPSPTLP